MLHTGIHPGFGVMVVSGFVDVVVLVVVVVGFVDVVVLVVVVVGFVDVVVWSSYIRSRIRLLPQS